MKATGAAIINRVKTLAEKHLPNLPSDTQYQLSISPDGRIWVDILSHQYAIDNGGKYEEGADYNPVIEQYILVPSFKLQKEAPEFYKKYVK